MKRIDHDHGHARLLSEPMRRQRRPIGAGGLVPHSIRTRLWDVTRFGLAVLERVWRHPGLKQGHHSGIGQRHADSED